MHEGVILRIDAKRNFGFVGIPGRADAWFHVSQLAAFEEPLDQLPGRRVVVDALRMDRKGLAVVNFRPAK